MIKTLQFCLLLIALNIANGQAVFTEDFSTATGVGNNFSLTGWNQTRDLDTSFANGWTTDDSGAYVADGYNNAGTTGAMRINMTNSVKRDFLLTPFIDLSSPTSGAFTVKWDMSFRQNNSSTINQGMNAGDEIRLLVSIDGGATFTSLAVFDSTTTIVDAGETFVVELTDASYFVSNIQFAFYAFEAATTTLATNVFLDNFEINDETLSTTDFTNPEAFNLYPNPTEDNLYVKQTELSKVELYTILGAKIPVEYSGSTIYTSTLASGIYIVKLTNKKGNTEARKFIKK